MASEVGDCCCHSWTLSLVRKHLGGRRSNAAEMVKLPAQAIPAGPPVFLDDGDDAADRAVVFVGRADPRHHESDTVVRRGHITKQGSKLVRWAAVEAIQRHPTTSKIALDRTRIESRRGKNIAKIAVARKLLTLVYYGLRDGHIRALAPRRAA